MSADVDADAIADELLGAWDSATMVEPITARHPGFGNDDAYDVLAAIARRRRQRGWTTVGRKVGFTNSTLWPLYGVDRPMWAHVWQETVQLGSTDATVSIGQMVQPRIEPEVVFRLRGHLPATDDPAVALDAVASIAAGFEIVQCHFPGWRFDLPDCTAAFALHAGLVVGREVELDDHRRATLVSALGDFDAALQRDGAEVARGTGANVLGSPALALTHLARVIASQSSTEPLAADEIITTGTITDAMPIAAGETWTCDYGTLDLPPITLTITA